MHSLALFLKSEALKIKDLQCVQDAPDFAVLLRKLEILHGKSSINPAELEQVE